MSGSLRMPVAAAFATITASICLGPAFLIGSWFLPTAFGVLVVGAGCEVARRLSASRSTVPLGGLAALALYLLWRYGNDQAWLGIIPTSGSVDQLGKLASSGRDDINQYAAPIGVSPGIELLTVAGVGLIALVVDTLAVTWRRAALAGLP
ncbi:MAG TPA: transglutaminaseTgpA domain-containing protein, partial [Mycobacteriales bacterium]|nr:transglutaminaseTgpA domain-containing protein [Mycobacteriales bacterium]